MNIFFSIVQVVVQSLYRLSYLTLRTEDNLLKTVDPIQKCTLKTISEEGKKAVGGSKPGHWKLKCHYHQDVLLTSGLSNRQAENLASRLFSLKLQLYK